MRELRRCCGALESLDKVRALNVKVAYSGHGPALTEPEETFRAAVARYARWLAEPERLAWHACKRLFGNALMLRGGLSEAEVAPFLLSSVWFADYSRAYFGAEPGDFVQPLLAEMLRSRAAGWAAGRLVALTPHRAPRPGWLEGPGEPRDWPPAPASAYKPARALSKAEVHAVKEPS